MVTATSRPGFNDHVDVLAVVDVVSDGGEP
jgi:hypothetical protein